MKKVFFIVLASITLFAFTQCDSFNKKGKNTKNSDDTEEEDELDEDVSKEYQDFLKAAKTYEKALKRAKTCEDLEDALNVFVETDYIKNYSSERYDEDEQMTKAEERKAERRFEEIGDLYSELEEEFGCNDWENDDWDNWESDDWGDDWSWNETQEFIDVKKGLQELSDAVKYGYDCDLIEKEIDRIIEKYADIRYEDDERMTEEEEERAEELWSELELSIEKKFDELRCYEYADDDVDDWNDDDDWLWGESQEYKDAKRAIEEMTQAVKNATDCDAIEDEIDRILEKYDKEYDEKDQITDAEEEAFEKIYDAFEDLVERKFQELDCW